MPLNEDPDFGDGKAAKFARALEGTPRTRAWTAVVAANLPVPLVLGLWVTDASGKIGMAFGVLLALWLGLRACHVAREAMLVVIQGGWVVAVFQLIPGPHVAAGFESITLVRAAGFTRSNVYVEVDTLLGGLLVPLATAAILIAVAAAIGLLMRLVKHLRPASA